MTYHPDQKIVNFFNKIFYNLKLVSKLNEKMANLLYKFISVIESKTD